MQTILLAFMCLLFPPQHGELSTAAKRALELYHNIENQPFSPEVGAWSRELLQWLTETEEVNVTVCPFLVSSHLTRKESKKYGPLFTSVQVFAAGAYLLKNPAQSADLAASCLASVRGVIRTYDSMRREKPKLRIAFIDTLKEKDANGELEAFVKDQIK